MLKKKTLEMVLTPMSLEAVLMRNYGLQNCAHASRCSERSGHPGHNFFFFCAYHSLKTQKNLTKSVQVESTQ